MTAKAKVKKTKDYETVTGNSEERKAIILNVAKGILSNAEIIISLRNCKTPSAKGTVYNELRRKFEAYLKLNNSLSEGKMKLFDALMIPMKKGERNV